MSEAEKIEALKRACAEMILNTAKEAAARVMTSEMKSRRLEQDLISTKEEAARMLLRLKLMIDAKTQEADLTLLNQRKKVDELECQLNEAEGIILDLRAELNQVHEHLEEAKSKTVDHSRQGGNLEMYYTSGKASDDDKFNTSFDTLDANNCDLDKKNTELSSGCHNYVVNDQQDINPVQEPDLFINGCTQRKCASEASLADENFIIQDSANHEDADSIGNGSTLMENARNGKNESVRRSIRKRKLKHWDEVIGACSHPFKKARRAISSITCCKNNKLKHNIESHSQLSTGNKTQVGKKLNSEAKCPDGELGSDEIVKPDEHDTIWGLNSSSEIGCDSKCAPEIEASNSSHDKHKRVFQYTFSRRRRKGSIIYPDRKLSSGDNSLRKSFKRKQTSGLPSSSFLSVDSRKLVQVARQLISLSGRGHSN